MVRELVEGKDCGVLYVVATPLGNLEDITLRALRILSEADFIVAEDTRHTRKLLTRHEISAHLISCHQFNESERAGQILALLGEGKNLALVSDAGTPTVSDPGYRLVGQAAQAGFRVVPIPGACAAVAALSASGLPTDSHYFEGFLPRKSGQRRQRLEALSPVAATLIFYESPHRVARLCAELLEIFGDRRAVLARELTKVHEEFFRASLSEMAENLARRGEIKGECTLLVEGRSGAEDAPGDETVEEALREGLMKGDESLSRLAERVARRLGLGRRDVYAKALEMKRELDEAGEDE